MPVLGSLNSAANKDIMSKMCQNEYLWSKGLTRSQTTKFSTLPNSKSSQTTTFSLTKVGKGGMIVASNFSISYSVFKRLVLQKRRTKSLFGKG